MSHPVYCPVTSCSWVGHVETTAPDTYADIAERAVPILRAHHAEAHGQADPVDHPPHYNAHPSGVECIDVVEHMSFNLGNAIKYIWRADEKGNAIVDLRKAAWYVQREIERRERHR